MSQPSSTSSSERQASAKGAPEEDPAEPIRRFSYPVMTAVAPYLGSSLPTKGSFRKVRCQEISSVGLSFFWAEKPEFRYLVVALGKRPIYVTARIVRCDPAPDPSQGVLVECYFLGRVSISA